MSKKDNMDKIHFVVYTVVSLVDKIHNAWNEYFHIFFTTCILWYAGWILSMKGVFCFPQNFRCISPWNGMNLLEWDVKLMHKIILWFRILCTTLCNQCDEGLYISSDQMQQALKCNNLCHSTLSINSSDHTWCIIQTCSVQ